MTASPACRSRAVAMVQTASLARARLAPSATAARGTAAPRAQHSSRRAGCRHPPEPEEDAAPAAESAAPTLALATVKEQLMEAEESARRGTFWLGCGGGKGRLRPGAGPPLFLVFLCCALPPHTRRTHSGRPGVSQRFRLRAWARPLCRSLPIVLNARGELRRSRAVRHRRGVSRKGAGDLPGCA